MAQVIISEKPSVAADISNALGGLEKKDGWFESNDYLVTWAIGHMLELVPPEGYKDEWKKWSMKTLPIIPETFKTKSYHSCKINKLDFQMNWLNHNNYIFTDNFDGEIKRLLEFCKVNFS